MSSFATKSFPLNSLDCKVITSILAKIGAFNPHQIPDRKLVAELSEALDLDPDDVHYSLKHLRMAAFAFNPTF
ncbi:hypothetical protein HDF16_001599 [Granulicella aggregans]|uniref:Uncharacterized protein n=1 Tax=Granulicella aggregans TaxID=474949 RepID=A0A7W8E368_9BACT|nr:hypothetical protein [Granulicella aggregans]MBB5056914.1 hypothetical protein [Granulicella aggregans]